MIDADLMSPNGKRINHVSDFEYKISEVSSTKTDIVHRRSLASSISQVVGQDLAKHGSSMAKRSMAQDQLSSSVQKSV
jgi:hypothetical protein